MDVMRLLSVIILVLAASGASDASYRLLMAENKGEVKPNSQADSPAPTPTPLPIPQQSTQLKPEPKKNPPLPLSPPPPAKEKKSDEQKGSQGNSKNDGPSKGKKDDNSSVSNGPTGLDKVLVESCDDASWLAKCRADQDLVACLRHRETDSKDFVLQVQNKGENNLSVLINLPSSIEIDLNLTKHGVEKINVSSGDAKNNLKIVLNSGKEDCVLEIASSISGWNPLQQYAAQLTPTNGAYFMFAILTIAAGAWACWKFCRRGRRTDAGIPYQQLEMGAPSLQSSSALVDGGTGDGWDQSWDDEWDEEEATMRPSNTSPNGSVPSNGLSSRSANKKNNWEIE